MPNLISFEDVKKRALEKKLKNEGSEKMKSQEEEKIVLVKSHLDEIMDHLTQIILIADEL